MPTNLMAQIRNLADKDDVPVSQIVRRLLKETLDERAPKEIKQPKGEKKP